MILDEKLFVITLFLTFAAVRVCAHILHDRHYYGTPYDRSKTLTGFLRKNLRRNIHHIHLGVILLIFILPSLFILNESRIMLILFAFSLSLVVDQIVPFIYKNLDYFHRISVVLAFVFHFIVAIIAIKII
jgi:hypothetical protein